MTACQIEARNAVRSATEQIAAHPHVVATDLLAPNAGARETWTLEFVTDSSAGGVPPAILRELAASDLTLVDIAPQGDPPHYVATAIA